VVSGLRGHAGAGNATLPLAAGRGRAAADALRGSGIVRHPGQAGAVEARDRRADLRESGERSAQDTRSFEQSNGLDVIDLWLQTRPGHALDPDFLRAVELLSQRLEQHPGVDAVDGPTSVLRWARYIESGSDQLPTNPADWPKLAADLEQIILTQPAARGYVDVADLASVRLSIRGRGELFGPPGAMRRFVEQSWAAAQASDPALRQVRGRLAGNGVLAGEITERLLPTLTQSFALTAGVIFCRLPAGVPQCLGTAA
jgi:predicted RND superfamily exporter protein